MATGVTLSTTATGSGGINSTFQSYFSRKLLEFAKEQLRFADYAHKAKLPERAGAKKVTFTRFGAADLEPDGTGHLTRDTATDKLTEGTAISTFKQLSVDTIEAELSQYGQVIKISDVLNATQLFNHLEQATEKNAMDAALHLDSLVMIALGDNTDTTRMRYAQGLANHAAVVAASASAAAIVSTDVLDAVTQLRVNKTPMFGDSYVGIISPQVARDLQNDGDWIEAHKYTNATNIYKGELGSLHGCRFVITTNPYIADTQHTYAAGDSVISTFFVGRDAYGVPDLSSQSPYSPRVIIVDTADKSDPLNQTITVGFKTYYTCKVLNNNFHVELYSKTNYS